VGVDGVEVKGKKVVERSHDGDNWRCCLDGDGDYELRLFLFLLLRTALAEKYSALNEVEGC